MLAVEVGQHLVLVVRVAVALAVHLAQMVLLAQLTRAVAGVLAIPLLMVRQAVRVLSLFLTLAHKEAQAAQSHQAVATLFTHLHHQALTQHDYARATETAF
jgi:hypothetical protein